MARHWLLFKRMQKLVGQHVASWLMSDLDKRDHWHGSQDFKILVGSETEGFPAAASASASGPPGLSLMAGTSAS